jgi:hypothetical protein
MCSSGITRPPLTLCVFSCHTRLGREVCSLALAKISATASTGSRPFADSMPRSTTPEITPGAPCSNSTTWERDSTITSSPGLVSDLSAVSLPIVPLGTNRPASLPTSSAQCSWSEIAVGSSPQTSSPSSALAMALSISRVGRVNVSDRSSTISMAGMV